ncbi:GntR family transcriptional regulator [Paenibacillus chungangensis]|uniref:GntR family transcriptional regulator n=1 Tax=Paenibacillus chungangensis TaxID=696535 RepID=A0ABW3HRG9_9BACL
MVNKSNPVPMYLQIARSIRNRVVAGEFPVNSQIPTEDEILKEHGVSRMTARHAVTQLVNEGLVYRVHGKGAFVSATKLERNLNKLSGFFEDMQELGLNPSSKILVAENRKPTQKEQHTLQIRSNELVYQLTRIRYLNMAPVGIQTAVIPASLLANPERLDLVGTSLYAHLSKNGHTPTVAEQRMEAVLAPEIAEQIGVSATMPFFFFERVSCDQNKLPVEILHSHFRGDMYTFSISLYRD